MRTRTSDGFFNPMNIDMISGSYNFGTLNAYVKAKSRFNYNLKRNEAKEESTCLN